MSSKRTGSKRMGSKRMGSKRFKSKNVFRKDNDSTRGQNLVSGNIKSNAEQTAYESRPVNRKTVSRNKKFTSKVKSVLEEDRAVQTFVYSNTQRTETDEEDQGWTQIADMGSYDDLNSILTVIPSSDATTEFDLYRMHVLVSVTNMSNFGCNVVFYDCFARKDIPYIAGSQIDVASIITQGFTDVGTGASIYGLTLFQNPKFLQYFKIKKVRRVLLSGGETVEIKRSMKKKWTIRAASLKVNNVQTLLYEKGAYVCVMAQYGLPYNDNTTKTEVVPAPTALNIALTNLFLYTYEGSGSDNAAVDVLNQFGTITVAPNIITNSGQEVKAPVFE